MSERLLVLLHAAGQSPQMWQDQVTALPPGFRAVAPWLHGLRPAKADTFDVERAAAEVAQTLDLQGVRTASVCGLSLGARVALQFAIDHPDRCEALVLASPPARPPWSMRLARQAAMRVLPKSVYRQQNVDKAKVIQAMREVARIESVSGLEKVTAPTLLLCGSEDPASERSARALSERIDNAELQTIAGAGHMINTDRPEDFNSALYEFLG